MTTVSFTFWKGFNINIFNALILDRLLSHMCLAPANLRYGLMSTNSLIANNLDPMGDRNGKITPLEEWFRSLGNLPWGQATTCQTTGTTRVPCRLDCVQIWNFEFKKLAIAFSYPEL